MAESNFQNLRVYQLAVALADELFFVASRWPPFVRYSMGSQLIRAADSVAANIAEATGRWHVPNKRRVLFIARGSLAETEHWIARAERRGLLEPGTTERAAEIARAL